MVHAKSILLRLWEFVNCKETNCYWQWSLIYKVDTCVLVGPSSCMTPWNWSHPCVIVSVNGPDFVGFKKQWVSANGNGVNKLPLAENWIWTINISYLFYNLHYQREKTEGISREMWSKFAGPELNVLKSESLRCVRKFFQISSITGDEIETDCKDVTSFVGLIPKIN